MLEIITLLHSICPGQIGVNDIIWEVSLEHHLDIILSVEHILEKGNVKPRTSSPKPHLRAWARSELSICVPPNILFEIKQYITSYKPNLTDRRILMT